MVQVEKNLIIEGHLERQIALDVFYDDSKKLPVIIYAHGFNGFKDWGNFDLLASQFASNDLAFVKFNFSHNGTSPGHPEEFVDLEAFGNNNYSAELNDLQKIIEWVIDPLNRYAEFFGDKIGLIGHSMGGGIVLVKASEEKRINAVATWASVSELKTPWGSWPEERIKKWEEKGVEYYLNGRTKQNMPLYFQLFLDFQQNKQRLDVLAATKKLDVPLLVCHGKNDDAVHYSAAEKIIAAAKNGKLLLNDSDHVFGRKHPWTEDFLPAEMQQVADETIKFFKLNLV